MPDAAITMPDGRLLLGEQLAKTPRDRLKGALEHRKQFERTWQTSLALAAGKHWLTWDRFTRTLRRVQDVDPRYKGRELYTADVVTEYRMTALGELGSNDERPELLLVRDDEASENYQDVLNRAVAFGWDNDWDGDDAFAEADRLSVDLGTSAIRCYFDPTAGPLREEELPYMNGKPLFGQEAHTALAGGPRPDVQMQQTPTGRICWIPLSPFNILAPPGVTHEKWFPWEGIVRPVLLSSVRDQYGDAALDIDEDRDINSTLGMAARGSLDPSQAGGAASPSRLRDHVWLYTYFERPTKQWPQGLTLTFAGARMKLVGIEPSLPYKGPDGDYRSGITYFHWWRVTGRFWSRSLVEALADGQRAINKRRTQTIEIIDRSMPYTLVDKNSRMKKRAGFPGEIVELDQSERNPIPVSGAAPGPWMQADVAAIREDIEHATGMRGTAIGENPTGVVTYAQYASISEQEQTKRQPIHQDRDRAKKRLVEDTVSDMRAYWGRKQIMLAGDDDRLESEMFDATKIPPFFVVKVAKGAAKPRTQAAELTKVEQLWNAAVNAGVVAQNPEEWLVWYAESLDAGQKRELPEVPSDDQTDKARLENHFLLQGEQMPVAYYDRVDIHIPIHRSAQDQMMLSGDQQLFQLIEDHIQLHLQAAQQNAQKISAMQPPPPPLPPGAAQQNGTQPPGAQPPPIPSPTGA